LGVLSSAKQTELAAAYNGLNPVKLLKQINDTLELTKKHKLLKGNYTTKVVFIMFENLARFSSLSGPL